jgi:hypothetical protein
MSHLTDEQLAAWLGGESSPQVKLHIESCAHCRSESRNLRDRISRYSIALRRQAAESQNSHLAGFLTPRQVIVQHRQRWAGAGVLALLLVLQTAWLIKPRPTSSTMRPVASAPAKAQPVDSMSDDQLLEAVNTDLSREVPQALAPVSAITVARNTIAAATAGSTARSSSRTQGEQK